MKKASMKAADEGTRELERIFSVLHQWGIHSLGQLAALRKEDVVARLGPVAGELWERARGQVNRTLKRVVPPEMFAETFEFEQEIETAEPLLFILRRFLQQFAARLSALYVVVKQLTLRIHFADKTAYDHTFKIPQPTNDVELLFRMLETHLENFTSAAPIVSVALEAKPAHPAQQQFGLFETALRNPAQLAETLARLTALLGSDRVGRPVIEETHRPDAFHLEPFQWELPHEPAPPRQGLRCALRRFRSAPPAIVLLENNQPAHVRSSETSGHVHESAGPYALSGDWWDDERWARVEWDIELEGGVLLRSHQHGDDWAIDGIYD
jgi:protein ImuB